VSENPVQTASQESGYEVLVYTEKGVKSVLAGLLVLGFGALCFWLASLRPGEENGWVPWVVGGLFSAVGLFSVFGRARTVFDGRDRTWTDSWGFLFLRFTKRGSLEDLESIVVEESVTNGSSRYYVWVEGRRGIELLPETVQEADEAEHVAGELRQLLGLPVKKRRSG